MRYWMGVASREHVQTGVKDGFCQLCHGKAQPLKRMGIGDWIIYYSPQEVYKEKTPCQKFTAIGKVTGASVYSFAMSPAFVPYRRDIDFIESFNEVSIKPLIDELTFIKNKRYWGYAFRYGHLEINKADFEIISKRMLGYIPD